MNWSKTLVLGFFILIGNHPPAFSEFKNGMDADVVIGQPDFSGNSSGSLRNKLAGPIGNVGTDGKRIIIPDSGNNRVLIYNSIPETNGASPDVVLGSSNPDAAGPGGCARATLNSPQGAVFDGTHLFIADDSNNRVLIYNSFPVSTGTLPDVVIGQPNFTTCSNATVDAATFNSPTSLFSDGKRLLVADDANHRVLIFNSIPQANGASADIVIGQKDFVSQENSISRNRFGTPEICSDGTRLFVSDFLNNRVLIYHSIPKVDNALADLVIGQENFTSSIAGASRQRFVSSGFCTTDGKKLFVGDAGGHRVLVFDSIPTKNFEPAIGVLGQSNFEDSASGRGPNKFNIVFGVVYDGKRLYVTDNGNNRILIFHLSSGSSPIELGPHFEQGKSVLGKVFIDLDSNGVQEGEGEKGMEGVRIASDTGIYAVTDEDGKYHFPFIETGQHVLKLDSSTLPSGSVLTTENPRRIVVTEGVLSKVSFGIVIPEISNRGSTAGDPRQKHSRMTTSENAPLLKVKVTEDPLVLSPKLEVTLIQDKEKLLFTITCNYYLFIHKAVLKLYSEENLNTPFKEIPLSIPLQSRYQLPLNEIPPELKVIYYQLSVFDEKDREDRTGVGRGEIGFQNA